MPPLLALTLSLGFSAVLLYRETRQQQGVSRAVWIPCIWLLILGSRPISVWLNLGGRGGVDAMMEGSPTDRMVYLVLMMAAVTVVLYRRLQWGSIFRSNVPLVCFFAYCLLSLAWSDFPFIAFKRWFKSLGDPLMALILLSEAAPAAAVGSVLRRCAILLLPLSIVFIKYFPQLGKGYSPWSGEAVYIGVTTNKNMLGYLLLVFGLFFLCTIFTRGDRMDKTERRTEIAVSVLLLGMIAYLMRLANSQTSVFALVASTAVVIVLGSSQVRKYFGPVALASVIVGLSLEWLFGISEFVITSAGRDMTLTGRTDIWAAALSLGQSSLFGSGFQSFWLGKRLETMWAAFPVFQPNQAHNGYLEIYLNLGWIGLLSFIALLIGFYRTMRGRLERAISLKADRTELILAKYSIGYLVAYLLYNVTEAIFQPLNFLFIIFLVLGIRYRSHAQAAHVDLRLRPASAMPSNVAVGREMSDRHPWPRPARPGEVRPSLWPMRQGQAVPAPEPRQSVDHRWRGPHAENQSPSRKAGVWSPPAREVRDKYSR
jgi:exopolysaccharide production protein ExoQ